MGYQVEGLQVLEKAAHGNDGSSVFFKRYKHSLLLGAWVSAARSPSVSVGEKKQAFTVLGNGRCWR